MPVGARFRAGVWMSALEFSPGDIPGWILGLHADEITGLSDGDPVATWEDVSGEGSDLSQGVAAKKPVYKEAIQNGLPVVRFDGVDDYLYLDIADVETDFTLFITAIAGALDQAEYPGLFASADGAVNNTFQVDIGGAALGCANKYRVAGQDNGGVGRAICIDTYAVAAQLIGLKMVTSAPRAQTTWLNGTEKGTDTLDWRGRFEVYKVASNRGTSLFFKGDICQIDLYDEALSDANRQLYETGINKKWAIW